MWSSSINLPSLLESAREDPQVALVSLCHQLENHALFQQNLVRTDPTGPRAAMILEKLLSGGGLAEVDVTKDALAALSALDQFAAERYSGLPAHPRRVQSQGGKEYWVLRCLATRTSRIAGRQPQSLRFWVRHHCVRPVVSVGGIEIRIVKAEGSEPSSIPPLCVAGFGVDIGLRNELSPPEYRFAGTQGPEETWGLVRTALETAREQSAGIVLLPELTVCLPVRERVVAWLNDEQHPFHYVIPGSFHRPVANGTWVNEAVILDRYGETVLVQHKLAPMYRAGEEYERIEGQKTLNLLCTAFGVLSVGICLDFCDDNFQDLWKDAAPDLVLVPSMSLKTTLNAHKRRADYLFRHNGTFTAAALQPPPGESVGEFATGYFRTDRHHEHSRATGQSVCLWVNHCKPI